MSLPALSLPALSLAVLLSSLGTSIANVALPALAQAYGATFQQVQWVVLAYLLAGTAVIVSAGRLGDAIGRRRLLMAGIVAFTAASALCALAPTLPLLVAARALQGMGAAVMMAMATAGARGGSAMGLLGTMSAVGTGLGPALGGLLLEHVGWQAVFLVNLPLGLAALLLVRASPAVEEEVKRRENIRTTRALRDGLLINCLVACVMMATLVAGPFHLAGPLALQPAQVGLAMSCGPLVAALGGVPAGRMTDRFGARAMTLGGLATLGIGCIGLALSNSVAGYIAALCMLTAGYALFQAANNVAVMSGCPPEQRGATAGLLNLSRNLGLIGGASCMGWLFASGGLSLTFAVGALLVALAMTRLATRHKYKSDGKAVDIS